jgi:hypothetical protein
VGGVFETRIVQQMAIFILLYIYIYIYIYIYECDPEHVHARSEREPNEVKQSAVKPNKFTGFVSLSSLL